MNTARLEESRGNLELAKRHFEEIHRQDPQNAECLHRLAVICTRLNQNELAETYYARANALNPNNPELLADMGYAAFLRKDYEQSEALLEQSVNLRDNDRNAVTNLAIVRAWRGKDDSSLATFRRVNSESEAIRNLAAIQIARGDKERGIRGYDLAKNTETRNSTTPQIIAQTVAIDIAPLPADVVPPPPAALPESGPVSMHTISLMTIDSIENCTRTDSGTPIETAPLPPPTDQVPRNDYDTSLPPTDTTPSIAQVVDEMALLELGTEVMFKPVVAVSTAPAGVSTGAGDTQTGSLALEVTPSCPTVWRKTPTSQVGLSDDIPVILEGATIQQSSAGVDRTPDKANVWNICLVTLFDEKRLAPGSAEFSMEYESQQYRFGSAEALEKFRASPKQYAPAAGGLDTVSVRDGRTVEQGSLNFALWYKRQLYIFSTREHAEIFRRDPQKYSAAN